MKIDETMIFKFSAYIKYIFEFLLTWYTNGAVIVGWSFQCQGNSKDKFKHLAQSVSRMNKKHQTETRTRQDST